VGLRGESNHHPIFLEVAGDSRKLASPFKFNSAWLKEEEFLNLLKELYGTPLYKKSGKWFNFLKI